MINASFHAHRQEMESVKRDARAAREANQSLQDLVLRLQQGVDAEAARATRLRELELAFELQGNGMRTMQREEGKRSRRGSGSRRRVGRRQQQRHLEQRKSLPRALLWRNGFSAWRTELVIQERVRLCKGDAFRTGDDLPHGRRV